MKTIYLAPLLATALVLGVALSSFAADDDPAPAAAKPVQQWEHLAMTQTISDSNQKVSAQIKALGRKGWELVTVNERQPGNTNGYRTYYFKRPL